MNPETTLQEVLKPPFMLDDAEMTFLYDDNGHHLLDIRGWGFFQKFENGAQLQDEWSRWVRNALNEKAAREWGVRKRWVRNIGQHYKCPVCGNGWLLLEKQASVPFCCQCGERLDPPEGE